MHRRNRLGSSRLIRRIYSEGVRVSERSVTCTALVEGSEPPRVAVVASRRVGNSVERNRARRRLRAALRPLVDRMKPGATAVVAAGPDAGKVSFQNLEARVSSAVRRSGLLSERSDA